MGGPSKKGRVARHELVQIAVLLAAKADALLPGGVEKELGAAGLNEHRKEVAA